MKTSIIMFVCLFTSFNAFSASEDIFLNQSESQVSKKKNHRKKRSPISSYILSEVISNQGQRSELIQGTRSSLSVTGKHKFNRTDSAKLRLRTNYNTYLDTGDDFYVENIQLHFERKRILSEKKHGLNMKGQLRFYYLTRASQRSTYGNRGEITGRLYMDKRLSKKVKLRSSVKIYRYMLNKYKSDFTWNKRQVVTLNPEYKLSKKWKASLYFEYDHIQKFGEIEESESLEVSPGIQYSLARGVSLRLQQKFKVLDSFDGQLFAKNGFNQKSYSLNLFAKLF